jgi:hypothetical protein
MDTRKVVVFIGIAISVLGALAVFATVGGTGQRGQIEMAAYGVGVLLVTQAVYGISRLGE